MTVQEFHLTLSLATFLLILYILPRFPRYPDTGVEA